MAPVELCNFWGYTALVVPETYLAFSQRSRLLCPKKSVTCVKISPVGLGKRRPREFHRREMVTTLTEALSLRVLRGVRE